MPRPPITRSLPLMATLACASLISGCLAPTTPANPASRPTGPSSAAGSTPPPAASIAPTTSPLAETTAPRVQIARVPTAVLADVTFRPDIDPAAFSTTIDNPFMPLRPGTRMTYEGGDERIVIDVTSGTRVVMGVTTVAVRDRAYAGGRLIEDTEDWYAQDAAGNVWYFGEDTAECEGGAIVSRHGAWEAGVDGAEPGVVMLAQPRVGDHYRQEYYIGAAEDQARILRLRDTVEGPAGTFDDVLVTEDFTPLEPDHLEHKSYARGVGVVREATIRGGSGTLQLIDIETRGGTDPAVGAFDPCRE